MAIVQGTPSGVVVIPVAGPPGISIVGPTGSDGPPGPQGGTGPIGPAGPAGAGAVKTRTASTVVPDWCAVAASGAGTCGAAVLGSDQNSPPQILGICANGGAPGSVISFQSQGDMSGPVGSWTIGTPLYVGPFGVLTTTAPTSGWLVQIGVSVSITGIIISAIRPVWIAPTTDGVTLGGLLNLISYLDNLPQLPADPNAYPPAGGLFRDGDANGYRLVRLYPSI